MKDLETKKAEEKKEQSEQSEESANPPVSRLTQPWAPPKEYNRTCTLCGYPITALCLGCQGDINPECDFTTGRCQHRFHFHCLARHMRSKTTCPMGGHEWQFRKKGDVTWQVPNPDPPLNQDYY